MDYQFVCRASLLLLISVNAQVPGDLVLVAGATGGVGQILTAKLLEVRTYRRACSFSCSCGVYGLKEHSMTPFPGSWMYGLSKVTRCCCVQRGYKVRALTRSAEKAAQLLGKKDGLEIAVADARDASTLTPITEGISAVAAVTGTTAFPSKRWYKLTLLGLHHQAAACLTTQVCALHWVYLHTCLLLVMLSFTCRWDGNNGPEQTDYVAMKNLIEATPKSVKRFVLTTSAGVDRSNKLPFNILNLFGAHTSPSVDGRLVVHLFIGTSP